jgi:hypothetical protein
MSAQRLGRRRNGSGSGSNLRAWWGARPALARDITVILIVKACVLALIWFAFFRAPVAPHMTMEPQRVGDRLLAPAPAATPAQSPAKEAPHAVR